MRFSVIVPVFNKAKYVERALMSVLTQTYTSFELIVVDDGSTDESLPIVRQLLDGYSFVLITQENKGVSAARNNGVRAASGDYLCFLDADDWWEPAFLEKMNELVVSYPDAKLFSTSYYYYKNGRSQVRVNIPTGYFNYCKEYSRNLQMPIWTGATCVPRYLFDELCGFNERLCLGEDFDLWIRIALTHKVAFLNVPLAYYFQDVSSDNRLIGRLHLPENHMLWNMDYLAEEELSNRDYKILIDKLRVYGLKPYYISKMFHSSSMAILGKVDWSIQSFPDKLYYHVPLWAIQVYEKIMKVASRLKTYVISIIR